MEEAKPQEHAPAIQLTDTQATELVEMLAATLGAIAALGTAAASANVAAPERVMAITKSHAALLLHGLTALFGSETAKYIQTRAVVTAMVRIGSPPSVKQEDRG